MRILLKGGTLVNPGGVNEGDVSIADGVIESVGAGSGKYDEVFDLSGLMVMPGLIDMHVHLRDPGLEYKEDIASGTYAAVRGGFTAVACMPNTAPVADNETVITYILKRAQEVGHCRVYPIACITKGQAGEDIVEMNLLRRAGAVAFSDDGRPVMDSQIMRIALQYSQGQDALLIAHEEDLHLLNGGVMNEGETSTRIGLKGITRAAEEAMVARDLVLLETFGGRLHLAHLSTSGSVAMVRAAKARGLNVTAETAPHYFIADDSWVEGYDPNTKVNPPLRTREDVKAIVEGLQDGTLDVIATDHAPHHEDEKNVEYDLAVNGISGIETALPLTLELVRAGALTPEQMVEKLSLAPARILGVQGGVLAEGVPADVTVVDPDCKYTWTKEGMLSKGKNSPFIGRELQGRAVLTIVGGRIAYREGL